MYKGREGQWAFIFHRLSGLAILAYLMLHIISIGSFMFGEEVYMRIHHTYDLIPFRIGLVFVTAGVVYHALNGLRIIIMDFTGFGVKIQDKLWYLVMLLTLVATAGTGYRLLQHIQAGH